MASKRRIQVTVAVYKDDSGLFKVRDLEGYHTITEEVRSMAIYSAGMCHQKAGETRIYTFVVDVKESREPTFTTHDGVDKYQDEQYWFVSKGEKNPSPIHNVVKGEYALLRKGIVRFHCKDKANEYVEELIRKRSIVFTTEEGVYKYMGDEYWAIDIGGTCMPFKSRVSKSTIGGGARRFHTEEAADLFCKERDWKEGELYYVADELDTNYCAIMTASSVYGKFVADDGIRTVTYEYFKKCPKGFTLPKFK